MFNEVQLFHTLFWHIFLSFSDQLHVHQKHRRGSRRSVKRASDDWARYETSRRGGTGKMSQTGKCGTTWGNFFALCNVVLGTCWSLAWTTRATKVSRRPKRTRTKRDRWKKTMTTARIELAPCCSLQRGTSLFQQIISKSDTWIGDWGLLLVNIGVDLPSGLPLVLKQPC